MEVICAYKGRETGENCIVMSITSPNISQVMKTGRMTWAGLVAYTGEKINVCRILMGKPEGKMTNWKN
jgi:hypothetical protein